MPVLLGAGLAALLLGVTTGLTGLLALLPATLVLAAALILATLLMVATGLAGLLALLAAALVRLAALLVAARILVLLVHRRSSIGPAPKERPAESPRSRVPSLNY